MCLHQLQVSSHDASDSGNGDKGSKKSPAMYSLKIINPNNAGGELIINDLEVPKRPTSADEFKAKVCEHFSQYTMYVAYATIYRQVRIIDLGQIYSSTTAKFEVCMLHNAFRGVSRIDST